MGKALSLVAQDGFVLSAYCAEPGAEIPKGAIVLIQEAFGVNRHMRAVADDFARLGYVTIAPAMFDRIERNFEAGYEDEDRQRARAIMKQLDLEQNLLDIQAAIDHAKRFGKVAVVGYCFGGSMAFFASTRLSGLSAAVGYYGGMISAAASEKPSIPVMLHFGGEDASIPLADVDKIKAALPHVPVFVYKGAGHGFSCNERGSYHEESAALAAKRTVDLISGHVG
jgi:carboxymethylenebutenolidase